MLEKYDPIIERLLVLFGDPKTSDPALFLEEFRKAMNGNSVEALNDAIDRGVRTWTFFPRPAELLQILRDMAPARPAFSSKNWEIAPMPERTEEQKARSRQLFEECMANLEAAGRVRVSDARHQPDTSRPAFEKMQRESRNTHLHRDYRAVPSRKMAAAGERE